MNLFKKAEKKKAKLRLGISGPSGSGKTYSALRLASGFGGKIAVIDTEKGSASLYADKFNFDVVELSPPYTTERYIDLIKLAADEGYEIIIVDSISHAWAGEGGLLNQKEQLDARGGNSFSNWAKMTPKQEKLISSLISCPAHLVVTLRSKQEYIQVSENGKSKIQKVGLAPIQRDGFEYELTTVFDIAINHEAQASKDRTGLFVDKTFSITEEVGKQFRVWLDSGKELSNDNSSNMGADNGNKPPSEGHSKVHHGAGGEKQEPGAGAEKKPRDESVSKTDAFGTEPRNETIISDEQAKHLTARIKNAKMFNDAFFTRMDVVYGTRVISKLKIWQYEELLNHLSKSIGEFA